MADYSELKAAIRAAIYDNTEQAITGEVLQDILVEMVDALGVPAGGIPASELTQAVQQALVKALSAYQKPSTGIPAGDIASGVIPDVSQFITKTVTDLVHYYTKEETYTQQQVNDLIGAISQFHYEIYASLGDITSPASNVLYLIGPSGSGSDQYEEYVYANGAFTKIGDTSIDLSGYMRYTPQTLTEQEKAQARQNIGATAPEVFWATYGTTTAAEIQAAIEAGKIVAVDGFNNNKRIYMCVGRIVASASYDFYVFVSHYNDQMSFVRVRTDNNVWASGQWVFEQTANKAQTLSGNETNTAKYPSTKAVADALGKMGVVSQTQTWAGGSNGYDYTLRDLVYGLIPQSNIDLYEAAGATFNPATGYFEIGDLKDISYKEMGNIYFVFGGAQMSFQTRSRAFGRVSVRSSLPIHQASGFIVDVSYMFYYSDLEQIVLDGFNNTTNTTQFAADCRKLKKVLASNKFSNTASSNTNSFQRCYSLEEIEITLKGDISFGDSSRLSLASVVYMVENAANTSAITITLHATAFARCQADTTEYTYNEQTYTGIIAYAAAKNISIVSA